MADDLELTDEEREHIKQRRKEKKQKEWQPRTADSYSSGEKEAAFDRLHKIAMGHFDEVKNDGRTKDIEHWCYEAVLELLGPGVWDALNSMDYER
jgi:hypothetical protein